MLPMTGASAYGLPPATWVFPVGKDSIRHLLSGLEESGFEYNKGKLKAESLEGILRSSVLSNVRCGLSDRS